ncbi:MAG: hypothetical protein J7515_17330 [Caulobacter sp.]|nr:hypothetical protein [Caulobacter sp.]
MTTPHPQVRFSIAQDGDAWRWRAVLDGAVLEEGRAATRAIAAALVIRVICKVCGPEAAASPSMFAEAA